MNQNNLNRLAVWLALGAGVLDFGTGHGLLYAPEFTLRLMRVAPLSTEALIYLRMIGAFVSAVGFSYLWALLRWKISGDATLLRSTLELTIWFRLAVAGYSSLAIARGWLSPLWLSVPAADFFLAAAQTWLLRRGVFR